MKCSKINFLNSFFFLCFFFSFPPKLALCGENQRLFGVGPNASEAAVSLTDDSLRKREEKRKE